MTIPSRRAQASLLALLLLSAASGVLAACNTVRGAGQDAGSIGTDVSNGATAVRQGITRP